MFRLKDRYALLWFTAISISAYIFLAYCTQRYQSTQLVVLYGILFLSFLAIFKLSYTLKNIGWLVALGVAFRLLLIWSFPNLSDDIYRFVWDGRLLLNGIEPFAHLPSYYMQPGTIEIPGITSKLYYLLNSPDYFTIYPPIAQDIFWISVKLFPLSVHGSAIVMRGTIILAECGSIWLIIKLLRNYGLEKRKVLLYALNPLVILELTGNLHFEGLMIFFLLLGIYLFEKQQLWPSALFMALAIATKLIPLIFLPLFMRYLPWKKCLAYYGMIALFTLFIFLPMARPDLLTGMFSSVSLYFQKFEFNASIYYLLRLLGYQLVGYNIIALSGRLLALITFLAIILFTLKHKLTLPKPTAMMWVIFIYLLLATTVHPWYITTLLAFALFANFRFPVVWSFFIFLSYIGYTRTGFYENLWITALEYVIVIVYMLYEIYGKPLHTTSKETVGMDKK